MANDFAATIGNLINVQRIASCKNEIMRLETYVHCLPPDARLDRDTIFQTIEDELKLLYHYAGKLETDSLLYTDTIKFIKFRHDNIVA